MANTPQAQPIHDEWVELYDLFSIAVGTQLLLNCRGNNSIFLAESETQPAADFFGVELYPTRQLIVDAGSVGVWGRTAKTKGSYILAQEDFI